MGNTRDSSGVIPEGFALGIYIWTVECITCKLRWGVVWLVCTTLAKVPLQAYKLSSCFSSSPCSLCYRNGTFRRATSGSGSLVLLVVPQQTSRWSLRAFCTPWSCSISWNGQSSNFWRLISPPVLLALADYWLRGVWITTQVPLTPGLSQMNCTRRGTVVECSNHPNCHVLTTQFADSECSNCTTCWPGRYSRFTPGLTQYSGLKRSCNATIKADVTCFLTLANQTRLVTHFVALSDAGPHVTSRVWLANVLLPLWLWHCKISANRCITTRRCPWFVWLQWYYYMYQTIHWNSPAKA